MQNEFQVLPPSLRVLNVNQTTSGATFSGFLLFLKKSYKIAIVNTLVLFYLKLQTFHQNRMIYSAALALSE